MLLVLARLGAPSRDRTCDRRLKRPLLYQLSYRGIWLLYPSKNSNIFPVIVEGTMYQTFLVDLSGLARQMVLFYHREVARR